MNGWVNKNNENTGRLDMNVSWLGAVNSLQIFHLISTFRIKKSICEVYGSDSKKYETSVYSSASRWFSIKKSFIHTILTEVEIAIIFTFIMTYLIHILKKYEESKKRLFYLYNLNTRKYRITETNRYYSRSGQRLRNYFNYVPKSFPYCMICTSSTKSQYSLVVYACILHTFHLFQFAFHACTHTKLCSLICTKNN